MHKKRQRENNIRGAVTLLLMMLLWRPAAHAQDYTFEKDSMYYDVVDWSKRRLEVVKRPEGFYHGDVVVPKEVTINGATWTVTGVAQRGFQLCANLKSVTLPETVTSIGEYAFQMTPIKSLHIPDAVTTIGQYAFTDCQELTTLTLPKNLRSVADGLCYRCTALQTIDIPEGVTGVGAYAFSGCYDLYEASLPTTLTTIGDKAFYQCSPLRKVQLPSGLTSIGDSAFYHCYLLSEAALPEGLLSIGKFAFAFTGITEATIPVSLQTTGVATYAFCYSLEKVTIPEGITEIGNSAFYGCLSLTEIVLPSTVKKICGGAFKGSILKEIRIPRAVTSIDKSSFEECESLEKVYLEYEKPQPITACFNAVVSTIYVPRGSLQAYKESSYGWADFQLAEYDMGTGIDRPVNNSTVQKIYTIGGQQRKALGKGVNILRMSDGSVRKVVK